MKRFYESMGWGVIKNGLPDLFLFRKKDNGNYEYCWKEIKKRKDELLSESQIKTFSILKNLGFDVEVIYSNKIKAKDIPKIKNDFKRSIHKSIQRVKRPEQNKKRMVRITPKMAEKIVKMRKGGFTLREIGRAVGITHPAVLYFLKAEK